MNTLNVAFYCAATAVFAALPVLIVNWFRYMKSARTRPANQRMAYFPIKSVAFFVVPIVLCFLIAKVITTTTRKQVVDQLSAPSGQLNVYVNRQPYQKTETILSVLRQLAPYQAHHSHPTTRIAVKVIGPQTNIALELGRDSSNPREYWVFSPDQPVTRNNEIGRITTSLFDE